MSNPFQGASGPDERPGLRPLRQPAMSPEQSVSNQLRRLSQSVETLQLQHEGSFVTKEQTRALVKSLDRLCLEVNNGGVVNELQPTHTRVPPTTLERISDKLRDVSDRIENANRRGSDGEKVAPGFVVEIRDTVVDCQSLISQSTLPGESPPPAPRACFGRDELIEKIVGLAENSTPIALIGAGGIGKTCIALTVLHDDRIKRRFGGDRRFIRCDQFPASCAHLLARLSKAVGADIENPEDLASLLPFLSSRAMLIILDNAESILDPQGADAEEIHGVVEELSQLGNVCLCITSRITAIPPDYKTIDVPALSTEAARDTFYGIYTNSGQTGLADKILGELGFHPLSITLLATAAHQNRWNMDRLTREWERQRTSMLQMMHYKNLAAAIELSIASPLFQDLGPDARALLEVIAFLPQGVDEGNLHWQFPTIPNGADILDKFCLLSLTHRNSSFVTMLAPLRDYLRPRDPKSSPLLCMTKERYFARMSVNIDPNEPGFEESRWIVSEDVNIEHLLDVFTTIEANSNSTWLACVHFMEHLGWHKKRLVIFRSKIEGLPDDHHFKPDCLSELSRSFQSVGNHAECKRLLTHALELTKNRKDGCAIVRILGQLSEVNRRMGLHEEGIRLTKESLEISERLGNTMDQAWSLKDLASLQYSNNQLDAAAEAASHAIDLFSEQGDQYAICVTHRLLGDIYHSKGRVKKALHCFKVALGMAASFNWDVELFWGHSSLAAMFLDENRLKDAQAHIEQASPYTVDYPYHLGRVMELRARAWCKQHKFEEARSEVLRAIDIFEKLEAAEDVEGSRAFLWWIEERSGRE